jgi:hypothetical protein
MSKRIIVVSVALLIIFSMILTGCEPEDGEEAARKIGEDMASFFSSAESSALAATDASNAASEVATASTDTQTESAQYSVDCHARPSDDLGSEGGGQVSFDPYSENGQINAGSSITFIQNADDGFVFDKWQVWQQGADTKWSMVIERSDPTLTITVDGNTSVDALFKRK